MQQVTVKMPQEQVDIVITVLLCEMQRLQSAGPTDRLSKQQLSTLMETLPPLLAVSSDWVREVVHTDLRLQMPQAAA